MRKLTTALMTIAAVALMGNPAQAALTHHWTLDGNPNDSAGSMDLSESGDVGYATNGVFGQAATFDGDADYLSYGGTPPDDDLSEWSMAAWFYVDVDSISDDMYIGGSVNSDTRGKGIRVNGTTGKIESIRTESNFGNVEGPVASTKAWTHVALTLSDTDTTDFEKLYVNGVLEDTSTSNFTPGSWNNTFAIGQLEPAKLASQDFKGMIDDFRYYDHVLSDSEVQALIPEPTSLALLGLGGLALLMNRRRRQS